MPGPARGGPVGCAWALLLAHVYEVFLLVCGAEIFAFITDGPTVRSILAHRVESTSQLRHRTS